MDKWLPAFKMIGFERYDFVSHHYDVWENGKIVSTRNIDTYFRFTQSADNFDGHMEIFNNPLPSICMSMVDFDICLAMTDRLMLCCLALESSIDAPALAMTKMTLGHTRESKVYGKTEPFIVNLFTDNAHVTKVALHFANPDRMIEFVGNSCYEYSIEDPFALF